MKKLIFPLLFMGILATSAEVSAISNPSKKNPYYQNWLRQYKSGKFPRVSLRSSSQPKKYYNFRSRFSTSAMKNLTDINLTQKAREKTTQRKAKTTYRASAPRRVSKRYGGFSYRKLRRQRAPLVWPKATPRYKSKKSLNPREKIYWQDDTLRVTINPVRKLKPLLAVDPEPIDIFDLNLFWPKYTNSIDFPQAVELRKLKFKIVENAGIVEDYSNFQLEIEDNQYEFEKDGTLALNFGGARIAQGKNLNLDIKLSVKDPDQIPHIPGQLRVQLTSVQAVAEGTSTRVKTRTKGSRRSDIVRWEPIPRVSDDGTSSFRGAATKIEGQMLEIGTSAMVLALNLQANYDDLVIDSMVVTDELSSGSIDTWTTRLKAIDLSDGRILGQTRFIDGQASFKFWSPFSVKRGQTRKMGFEISLADRVDLSRQNTQFKLDIPLESLHVRGIGSGKDVPDSNKSISIQAESFFVINSPIQIVHSADQPRLAAIGSPVPVYRFKVKNLGSREISLERIAMDIRLSNLEYPGGISADDFDLRSMKNGQPIFIGDQPFSATTPSSTKVIFDANHDVRINGHDEVEFALITTLENNTSAKHSSLSVQILGDSELTKGNLQDLKDLNKNFIWSDQSARLHSTTTEDYLSGFKVFGLPTNTFVNKN